jgi:hypothetical protein
MTIQPEDDHLFFANVLGRIEVMFDGKMYIGLVEVASFMGMSTKTLRRHADLGNICFAQQGFGRTRIRRLFAAHHVARFCVLLTRGGAGLRRPASRMRLKPVRRSCS